MTPDALRRAAAPLLPPGAFLRRDRGDALFVTDAPRLDPGADWAARFAGAGFLCREANGLMYLTPGPGWLARLEKAHPDPPDALCKGLTRFAGLDPGGESLALFALGLKALEAGDSPARYDRLLRQRAAVCLRLKSGGGGLYACGILNHLLCVNGDGSP